MDITAILAQTKQQMATITGLTAETVARFDREDEGWCVAIDMVEHRAIPRTNDLLASIEVKLDADGNVRTWKRTGRCLRSQGGETG